MESPYKLQNIHNFPEPTIIKVVEIITGGKVRGEACMLPNYQSNKSNSQNHEDRDVNKGEWMLVQELNSILKEESLIFKGVFVHNSHYKKNNEQNEANNCNKYF